MYSRIEFRGDGTTTRWPVVFTLGYLRREYVQCRVNDEVDASGDPVYRTLTWDSNDDFWVTIEGTVPTMGQEIVFTRTVPVDELLYDFQRGAHLGPVELNESHQQLMMAIHQMLDEFEATVIAIEGYEEAVQRVEDLAIAAAASASSAATSATNASTSLDQARLSAAAAAVSAQEALDRMNGTVHKSRVFNVRASWGITADTPSGNVLTLPETYFPTRNHMMLFYNGVLCEIKSTASDAMYQYDEVGSVDTESDKVVLNFPVYNGDRFDMMAVASGVLQNLDELEQVLTEATTMLANLKDERIPGMIHMMADSTFVQGVREGLYHPVHKITGLPIFSLGLCNGGLYDAVSTVGIVQTPNMGDTFPLGCSANGSDVGEAGGSDTHTSALSNANVSVNNHWLTINQIPAHTHGYYFTNNMRAGFGGGSREATNGWNWTSSGAAGGGGGHAHDTTQTGHAHTVTGKPKYIKVAYVMAL